MVTNSSAQTASTAVVEAIAAREGVDPIDIAVPLHETISSSGLDAVCESSTAQVMLEYCGYVVSVNSDNEVGLLKLAEC